MSEDANFSLAKKYLLGSEPISVAFYKREEALFYQAGFSSFNPETLAALQQGKPNSTTRALLTMATIPPLAPTIGHK